MSEAEKSVIIRLLAASVVFLLAPLVFSFFRGLINLCTKREQRQDRTKRMLFFSAFLLGAIWCLRYAVGYYKIACGEEQLTAVEEIFNSIAHALQTFSMDEEYTSYILKGKEMMLAVFNGSAAWADAYGIYASVLNTVAPIAGGAIVLEILASAFPRVRLLLSYAAFWKKKYYFSELNAASLAAAKSIRREERSRIIRSVIIFTDAYVDRENENSTELLQAAKGLGGICVRADIAHVVKNHFGVRKFFLVDENEISNLRALTNLTDRYNFHFLNTRYLSLFAWWRKTWKGLCRRLRREDTADDQTSDTKKRRKHKAAAPKASKDSETMWDKLTKKLSAWWENGRRTEIFLFSQNDVYRRVERQVQQRLRQEYGFREKEMPVIKPVQRYRNMISVLLDELPLYEPLIHRRKAEPDKPLELQVTILGTGEIGTEMFLSTYWFGQMYHCRLSVHIVSQEEERSFWGRIDSLNPEIKRSVTAGDPLLTVDRTGKTAEPYCHVDYMQFDVYSEEFAKLMTEGGEASLAANTDYMLVALGTDAENLSVANKMRNYIGQQHIALDGDRKTVIAYVVYDTALARLLNRQKRYCFAGTAQADIYMRAVGSLDTLYSIDNLDMSAYKADASEARKRYDAQRATTDQSDRGGSDKSDYTYWANIARGLHRKYRMFCAGFVEKSVFDDPKEYDKAMTAAETEYEKLLLGNYPADIGKRRKLLNDLAWMEKRRWNAFTRVKGYRYTQEYLKIGQISGDYRQMDLKLHPCLVECDAGGICVACDEAGYLQPGPLFLNTDAPRDLLDTLSYVLWENCLNDYDFKQYDYPVSIPDKELPAEYAAAAEYVARQFHEKWCEVRQKAGWRYGEDHSFEKKTTPKLREYSQLKPDARDKLVKMAREQLKLIYALGYKVRIPQPAGKEKVPEAVGCR